VTYWREGLSGEISYYSEQAGLRKRQDLKYFQGNERAVKTQNSSGNPVQCSSDHFRPHRVIGSNRNDITSDMDALDTRAQFDPLSDLEERRVIFAALDSFQ
jgi:hypothetical protein